ncbi:thymidine phosphorylase-like [Diadema setosum]|uniref:thymidine phosphorylase-like n=1 Tax=Diadema setosum TaxID=31175 RepID=UPI003B3B1DA3
MGPEHKSRSRKATQSTPSKDRAERKRQTEVETSQQNTGKRQRRQNISTTIAMPADDESSNQVKSGFKFTDVVKKKINGEEWSDDEITWFIQSLVNGDIQEAQIGAWLMAVRLKSMTTGETTQLTQCMLDSGEVLDWSDESQEFRDSLVDKHSTGGVGDKVSLILAPALAACGLKVPMISGRGLGHTGGTLDKLESMKGFQVQLSVEKMREIVENVGCCISGQTKNLVPADKKLYAIRDVTGTIDSVPLITGSIISKKSAEKVKRLVLDVKVGKAAFCTTEDEGRKLAQSLVNTSCGLGTETTAVLTRMDDPIGCCIGNTLEVAESIQCLKGKGPTDLHDLVVELGAYLLKGTPEEGRQEMKKVLQDGSALEKFKEMIVEQGVKKELADKLCSLEMDDIDEIWAPLPVSKDDTPYKELEKEEIGFVADIDAFSVADVCLSLGAGRKVETDVINHSAGVRILAHVGSKVKQDEPLMKVYYKKDTLSADMRKRLQDAVSISQEKPEQKDIVISAVKAAEPVGKK